jgi:hypothetical protein
MSSIYDSWSCDELSVAQKEQYEVVEVGVSFHSFRTTFRVTCRRCGVVLHSSTNGPMHYIGVHGDDCKGRQIRG